MHERTKHNVAKMQIRRAKFDNITCLILQLSMSRFSTSSFRKKEECFVVWQEKRTFAV